MAKLALINRNEKRKKLVAKFAKKRESLHAIMVDPKASDETRYEARLKIQALPRNSNKTRIRNRCALTGRPRAVYRKFGLSRIAIREKGLAGEIPGLTKSSW